MATQNRYRERLTVRRDEIEALRGISALSRSAVELDQTSVGRVSRIDAMQAQQMALAQERAREAELSRIAAALKRIEDGEYGDCIECGEPIAEKRLDFDPSVATCIDCAR